MRAFQKDVRNGKQNEAQGLEQQKPQMPFPRSHVLRGNSAECQEQKAEKQGRLKEAKEMAASLDVRYGADRLDGMGEDDLLTDEQAAIYWSLSVLDVPEEPAVENP